MIHYRPFRNTDPPILTALWRSRAGQQGLVEHVSPDLLEQLVFAKLHFDQEGLILAWDDDRPVGFAHAAFGPDETRRRVSTDLGVTCLVLVRPDCCEAEVASGLLMRCEQYLRGQGAKVLYGGGIRPLNPFYLGLYGGSEMPGVLDRDTVAQQLYRSHEYREIDRTLIMRLDLTSFQAVIDRDQMQIRRRMIVEVTPDPRSQTWWEACTLGEFDLTQFDLIPRGGGRSVASALFRSMDPTGGLGSSRAAGLIDLQVDESYRRRGLATFLLSEAFRQFVRQGVALVEAQAMQHNSASIGVYRKFGFCQTGYGSVFRKDSGQ